MGEWSALLWPNAYVKSPIFARPWERTAWLQQSTALLTGQSSRETPGVLVCGQHYSDGRTNVAHSRTKSRRKWETGREDQGDQKAPLRLRLLRVSCTVYSRVDDDKNGAQTDRPRAAYIWLLPRAGCRASGKTSTITTSYSCSSKTSSSSSSSKTTCKPTTIVITAVAVIRCKSNVVVVYHFFLRLRCHRLRWGRFKCVARATYKYSTITTLGTSCYCCYYLRKECTQLSFHFTITVTVY